jgi:hypothetical protein
MCMLLPEIPYFKFEKMQRNEVVAYLTVGWYRAFTYMRLTAESVFTENTALWDNKSESPVNICWTKLPFLLVRSTYARNRQVAGSIPDEVKF